MEKVIEPISTILLQKNFRPFFASQVAQKLGKNTLFCGITVKKNIFDAKDDRRVQKDLYLFAKNGLYTHAI